MSEANHTPGPWGHIVDPEGKYGITGADHKFLAITDTKANARLIAAAPDMLDALRKAETWLCGWGSAEPYLSEIRDVIAEATGE